MFKLPTKYPLQGGGSHPAQKYIMATDGPIGISRGCVICGYGVSQPKLPRGTAGRGWGMRHGNILRGKIIQHIKAEHPKYLA